MYIQINYEYDMLLIGYKIYKLRDKINKTEIRNFVN